MFEEQPMPDAGGTGSWPSVLAAREALAAVLVGVADDVDMVLLVGEALSVLNEATPPYPPLDYPEQGVTPEVGIPEALEALAEAATTARSVEEAVRFARGAEVLSRHGTVVE